MDGERFHMPTFPAGIPDGYAGCQWCDELITVDQLHEACPGREEQAPDAIKHCRNASCGVCPQIGRSIAMMAGAPRQVAAC